jgi:hypothetical protein
MRAGNLKTCYVISCALCCMERHLLMTVSLKRNETLHIAMTSVGNYQIRARENRITLRSCNYSTRSKFFYRSC